MFHYLEQHPDVKVSLRQEVHYFDNNYHKGETWHRAHFPIRTPKLSFINKGHGATSLTLTSAPYYLFHPFVPERMVQQKYANNFKFIILLRNPVDRAFSHYRHELKKSRESMTFEQAVKNESKRLAGEGEKIADPRYKGYNHQRFSYISRGHYAEQMKRWLRFFPMDKFFIIKSEDMFRDAETILKRACFFLGLQPHKLGDYNIFNKNFAKVGIDSEFRKHLVDYFAPFNDELYTLIGRDFGWD